MTETITTQIIDFDDTGRRIIRPPREGEAASLIRRGFGQYVLNIPESELRSDRLQRILEERTTGAGAQVRAAVEGGLNALTVGGYSAAAMALSPQQYALMRHTETNNPGSSMIGAGLAAVATGGRALLTGAIGAGARAGTGTLLARMTPLGATAGIGQSVARTLARSGRVSRAGAVSLGLAADAAVGGGLYAIESSNVHGEALTPENMAVNTGIASLLGLGIGYAGSRLGGAISRGRRARAARAATASLTEAGLPDGAARVGFWARVRGLGHDTVQFLSERSGFGRPEAFRFRDPDLRIRAARGEAALTDNVNSVTDTLNVAIEQGSQLIPVGTPRNAAFNRLLAGADHRPLREALIGLSDEEWVARTTRSDGGQLWPAFQEGVEWVPTEANRLRRVVDGVREVHDGTQWVRASQSTEYGVLESIGRGLDRVVSTSGIISTEGLRYVSRAQAIIDRGILAVSRASNIGETVNALGNVRMALRNIPVDRNLPGAALTDIRTLSNYVHGMERSGGPPVDAARGQTGITAISNLLSNEDYVGSQAAELIRDFLAAEGTRNNRVNNLLSMLGSESVGGDGAAVRLVDRGRVEAALRQGSSGVDARNLGSIHEFLEHEVSYRNAAREIFDLDAQGLATHSNTINTTFQTLDEGQKNFAAFHARQMAETLERQSAGFQIVTGMAASGAVAGALGAYVSPEGFEGVGGGVAGAAGLLLSGAVIRPASFYGMLGNLERAWGAQLSNRTQGRAALSRTLSGRGRNIRNISGRGTRVVPDMINRLRDKSTRREEYLRVTSDIRELASNPAAFEERFLMGAGEVGDDFPDVMAGMAMTAQRAVVYLNNSLPPASRPTPFDHLPGATLEPSFAEMDGFLRILHAIEDPSILLYNAADFTLTNSEVEAVREVLPETFAAIQQAAMEELESMDKLPPYQARLQIGTLLGAADPSQTPSFIESMQRTSFQTRQQQRTQISISSGRTFNVAGNTYSESQQIQQRL